MLRRPVEQPQGLGPRRDRPLLFIGSGTLVAQKAASRLGGDSSSFSETSNDRYWSASLIADIPFPAPENVAAKRCASEKRAF